MEAGTKALDQIRHWLVLFLGFVRSQSVASDLGLNDFLTSFKNRAVVCNKASFLLCMSAMASSISWSLVELASGRGMNLHWIISLNGDTPL